MSNQYSKPPFLLIPDSAVPTYINLFHIACSYNTSAKLVKGQFDETGNVAFLFPSIVCQSFAIELFLKFFIFLDADKNKTASKLPKKMGHDFSKLWNRISSEYQKLISTHYSNAPKPPTITGGFEEGLSIIGNDSFEKWRYAHEIQNYDFMHLDYTDLVSDVLYSAANFGVMKFEGKQS